ncbi:NHLP-related RiPP peptide [Stenotrophomonas sp. ISL-67]|uniref:NHLP-related RiPP peptide n=1 Tax=Stenotrophomonas sp. ISL-67 TaxID=2819171 RepID=UPI001BE54C2A|nr:NHLP-related RiPP peptide [Stenotrophomonas sp. ISL-67]MBT2767691.1 NHLP-related RiPP peptide [Stenotrophomonas sp. ISL-67]
MTSTSAPLPADTVRQLLDLLTSDDGFRETFSANPSQALATLGVDTDMTRNCCDPIASLASKDEFQAMRDEITKQLQVKAAFRIVFCFEAGGPAPQLGWQPVVSDLRLDHASSVSARA